MRIWLRYGCDESCLGPPVCPVDGAEYLVPEPAFCPTNFMAVVAGEVATAVRTVSGWEITTHRSLEKAGGPQPAVPQLNGGTLHRLPETAGEPRPASIPQLHGGTLHRLPQTAPGDHDPSSLSSGSTATSLQRKPPIPSRCSLSACGIRELHRDWCLELFGALSAKEAEDLVQDKIWDRILLKFKQDTMARVVRTGPAT
jgi:hypothetical protein